MNQKKEKQTYEEALEELEEIISKLEEGNLDLDESLDEFQQGIELYKYCNNILKKVDGKIKIILEQENGTLEEIDFDDKL